MTAAKRPLHFHFAVFIIAAALVWVGLMAVRLLVDIAPQKLPPTPIPTPSAVWHEYINTEHGIALRYPSGWIMASSTVPDIIAAWETPDTEERIASGRVDPERRYTLSIRVYPTLADLPQARTQNVRPKTVQDLFSQVRTIAPQGLRDFSGLTLYEYIANEGGQHYALLAKHRSKIYVFDFERTWTKARFEASRWERQTLETLAFTVPE